MPRGTSLVFSLSVLAACFAAAAHAQDAPAKASIKISNESAWVLDCRVTWGPNILSFNNLASGTTSGARDMATSGSSRIAICKKRGATPTPKTTSLPLQFTANEPDNLTLKCSHPAADPNRLACAISKD